MPLDNLQAQLARRSEDEYSLSLWAPQPRRAVEWMVADTTVLPQVPADDDDDTLPELVVWAR